MGNVTAYPVGLTDLLKVRDLGQLPANISPSVALVLDALDFYANNGREGIVESIASGTVVTGLNPTITAAFAVPQNEIWYVQAFTVAMVLGAGGSVSLAPCATVPGNFNIQYGTYASGGANEFLSAFSERPFWALAGTRFGAFAQRATLPGNLSVALNFTRYRV